MEKSKLRQMIREELQKLNEGTSILKLNNFYDQVINSIPDIIGGLKGEYGLDDEKYKNREAIIKALNDTKKALKIAKKASKSGSGEIRVRGATFK